MSERTRTEPGDAQVLPFATDDNLFGREARRRAERAERSDYLAFRMGHEAYGAPLTSLLEVTRLPELTEVPGAPDAVLGIFSLRGSVVPVVDLHELLDVGARPGAERPRVIVIELAGGWVGLQVDAFLGVLRITPQRIEEPSPSLLAGRVGLTGIVHLQAEDTRYRLAVRASDDLQVVFLVDFDEVLGAGLDRIRVERIAVDGGGAA